MDLLGILYDSNSPNKVFRGGWNLKSCRETWKIL